MSGVSNTFLFKPVAHGGKPLVVLTPNSFNNRIKGVSIVDPSGNVIEQGRFTGNEHNGARGHFRFNQFGNAYAGNNVQIDFDDGTGSYTVPISNGGQRFEGTFGEGGSFNLGSSGGGGGGSFLTSAGGNSAFLPSFVDYSSLPTPNVNFDEALRTGQEVGEQNRENLLANLSDPIFRDAALTTIDTDLTGIEAGLGRLAPFARAQGDIDTQTNIERAGQIDDFNRSRISGINTFNRGENDASIDSTGINFRGRANTLLDQLEVQATGGLDDATNDRLLTSSSRDRGADIAAGTGAGGRSGSSFRTQDLLDIDRRIDIQRNAQGQLAANLQNFQSRLQAPTVFQQPTDVPLNTSNIQDRVPLTANVSAGQVQTGFIGDATNQENINPNQAFTSNLSTQQFNEQAVYNRAATILSGTQEQYYTEAAIQQGLINADKADEIRDENFAQLQAGLDQRESSETTSAVTSIATTLLDSLFGGGSGSSGGGSVIGGLIDSIFGDGDDSASGEDEGFFSSIESGFGELLDGVGSFIFGGDDETVDAPSSVDFGNLESLDFGSFFSDDLSGKAASAAVTGDTNSLNNVAVQSLAESGLLGQDKARNISSVLSNLTSIANPSTSNEDRALASAAVAAELGTTSFTGTVESPTSIGGLNVIGSSDVNGSKGFLLADGSSVSQDVLRDRQQIMAGVNAVAAVAGNGTRDQKVKALTQAGVSAGKAAEIISESQAGNFNAALQVFNTATKWGNQNDVQKAVSIAQATATVSKALGLGTLGGVTASGIGAGALVGGLQASGLTKFVEGKELNALEKAGLALPTFGLSLISDQIGSALGFDHSKNTRDLRQINDTFRALGVLNSDYNLVMTDGTVIDFDANHQVENYGKENKFNTDDPYINKLVANGHRANYEIDPTHPLSAKAVGVVDPIAEKLANHVDAPKERITGYIVSNILQNKNVKTMSDVNREVNAMFGRRA